MPLGALPGGVGGLEGQVRSLVGGALPLVRGRGGALTGQSRTSSPPAADAMALTPGDDACDQRQREKD